MSKTCNGCGSDKTPVNVPYLVHEGDMSRLERQLKRLWIVILVLIFLLVGEVEVIAQEQPSIAEVKTYFRTQIRSEFQALVAGFGTDFKILLPCTLLQTENQVVLVGSNVVGVDRIDKLEFPFFLCRNTLVFFLCLKAQGDEAKEK